MARCILTTGGGGGVTSDDVTTTADKVLNGYTYLGSDTDDEIGTGTMPNNGAVSKALNCGGSYAIPAGYHNGSGVVTANSLSSQTSATAAAGNILTGKTAWVNGSKITGTMPTLAGASYSPTKGSTRTISVSGHYMTSNITIPGFAMPDASKLAKGYTYTLYGQSVTGTCVTVPTASTRYLIKNGEIQENNGGWDMLVKGGSTGKYSIANGLLNIDSGYGSSVPDYTSIITVNPIYQLSSSAISKYQHLYITYYIVTGNTKYNSYIDVRACTSRSGDNAKQLLWTGFYAGDLKNTWHTDSVGIVTVNDVTYPYLYIKLSSQSSSAHTEVRIQNLWYSEA